MAVVKQDSIGVYVESGGYIARPVLPTQRKVGDDIPAKHFGGSVLHGIDKAAGAKRGEYSEYWMGCGMAKERDPAQRLMSWEWYLAFCGTQVVLANRKAGDAAVRAALAAVRAMAAKNPTNPASLRPAPQRAMTPVAPVAGSAAAPMTTLNAVLQTLQPTRVIRVSKLKP